MSRVECIKSSSVQDQPNREGTVCLVTGGCGKSGVGFGFPAAAVTESVTNSITGKGLTTVKSPGLRSKGLELPLATISIYFKKHLAGALASSSGRPSSETPLPWGRGV